MEALNAASLTPISVLSERRTEARKFTTCSVKLPKTQKLKDFLSGNLHTGLVLVSSLMISNHHDIANALTYEEALEQSASTATPDIDIGILDSVINFGSENPIVIAGGVAVLAVPLIVSQLLKQPKSFGVLSAKAAYEKLGVEENGQLVDIRGPAEIREVGSPNIKGLGKKVVAVAYKPEDKNGFLNKLALKFKKPESTTLFVLDKLMFLMEARFDGNSELVAELVTLNGYKSAYAIKDGVEGPKGWKRSGLPWTEPKKGFKLDFSSLSESISAALGLEDDDSLPVALGVAVATALGALAYTEVETILQLLGSLAIIQVARNKLLLAEDRKKTLTQVDEFLNTKIAPNDLVEDLKEIGVAFLPFSPSKSLPAPTITNSEPVPTTEKVEVPQVNSVSTVEVQSPPTTPTPLSPYPTYEGLKPPTSPTPTASQTESSPAAAPVEEVQSPPTTSRPLSPYPWTLSLQRPQPHQNRRVESVTVSPYIVDDDKQLLRQEFLGSLASCAVYALLIKSLQANMPAVLD
ncbi:hypothetical protein ACFE04_026306 [Oxalis oulophora]